MRKIYLASSWRNKLQPATLQILLRAGHEVYDFRNPEPGNTGFDWAEIDPQWTTWTAKKYIKSLNHPIAEKGFNFDFNAMKWADTCVLLLPCGRSAHAEAGWMKGAGKKVYVLIQDGQEPELMYKLFDGIFDDISRLLHQL